MPIHSTCAYPRAMVYPSDVAFTDLAGPLAVVPGVATPASRTSWGRLKITYR